MGVFDKLIGSFNRTTEGIRKYNDLSDEMKKKIDDAMKQLDDYNSQISTHELKWLELEVTMKSVIEDRIEKSFSSFYNNLFQRWEDEIDCLEEAKKIIKEKAQTEIDGIQKTID